MHERSRIYDVVFYAGLLLAIYSFIAAPLHGQSKVAVARNGDQFQLMVNGKPFFINGVGGTQRLSELRDMGGNSVRTWGTGHPTEWPLSHAYNILKCYKLAKLIPASLPG